MAELKIDILLATYNGEAYVEQQLQSLLEQTAPHIHIIARDDGSTDTTPNILQEYAHKYPNIKVIPTEKNLGVRGNYSRLMEASTAPYVMFCDQDDVWEKEKAALTLHEMQRIENLHSKQTPILVHTDLWVVDKDLKMLHPSFWKYTKLHPNKALTLNRLLVQNAITGCTAMINRPLLKKALPIPNECLMHDWWLGLVASAFGVISYIETPTIHYRQHGNNTLGAQKYTFVSAVRKWIKTYGNAADGILYHEKNTLQASTFQKRFKTNLSSKQNALLETYLTLNRQSLPKELYLTYANAFLKQGIARNIGSLFGKIIRRIGSSS